MQLQEDQLRRASILIVDDDQRNLRLLRAMLEDAGYRGVHTCSDPHEALRTFVSIDTDLLVLDLHMPEMDGFELMASVRPWMPEGSLVPILVLTGDLDAQVKERALASGAMDFLTRPFERNEVLLRIKNLLATRLLHRKIEQQNHLLEERIQERTLELERARLEILNRLARAAEFRDDDTGEHTRRVGLLSARLARVLGCSDEEVDLIHRAAPLHDLGKIGIPDQILLKPGRLDTDELRIMRGHTMIGAQILAGSDVGLLQYASSIALFHHERWDGKGYPEGIAGAAAPLSSRIVAVADVFDALTHSRPYKEPWSVERAVAELKAQAGRQFDPGVVEAFVYLVEKEGLVHEQGRRV